MGGNHLTGTAPGLVRGRMKRVMGASSSAEALNTKTLPPTRLGVTHPATEQRPIDDIRQ